MHGSGPLHSEERIFAVPTLPLSGKVFLLLTAAGSSSRFGGEKKEFLRVGGKSILQRSLEAFLGLDSLAGVVVTFPEGRGAETRASIAPSLLADAHRTLQCGISFSPGGATRQESVFKGLSSIMNLVSQSSLDPSGTVVLVHDAARPWVTERIIADVIACARKHGACIPLCDFSDTPKMVAPGGFIESHPARDIVKAAQTPQGFALGPLFEAYGAARDESWQCTDDSSLWARYIGPVAFVAGDRKNIKVTYREDIEAMEGHETDAAPRAPSMRIGEGWDIHPLVPGRNLVLGGIHIESSRGEAGHSDGDVLWHAIIDALLGAAGLGDIGTHFPPSGQRWKDAESSGLAKSVADMVFSRGLSIRNIDSTVILEEPRLGPYREAICAHLAEVLGIPRDSVSVKAKTKEHFDAVGEGRAIEARAIVLLADRD